MPFGIDGIGEEVLNFFILVILSFIIFFAWKSTSVVRTDRLRPLGSRILLDPHTRRLQLIANTTASVVNSHPIADDSSRNESRESTLTEELGFDEVSSIEELTETILTEATESLSPIPPSLEELEQEAIIQVMDHNIEPSTSATDGLRQRNVSSASVNSEAQTVESVTKDSLNVSPAAEEVKEIDSSQQIRIKLKYLNDELKLVQGNLEEAIGDFKKRNFTVEIAAHKLVRLVFNGHLLQPESKTLKSCGLFDNCVVHCLIHNQKNTQQQLNGDAGVVASSNSAQGNDDMSVTLRQNLGPSNEEHRRGQSFRNRENGTAFCYLGMALVTITLLFCWFVRVQYSQLFSFYSTVGLILMTILFLIMIPLLILIERNDVTVPT